jgi:hypothetical protein
MYALINSNVFY